MTVIGPWVVSPPISCTRAGRPARTTLGKTPPTMVRQPGAESAPAWPKTGVAPIAARSLRLTASALWPTPSGSASAKKCTPDIQGVHGGRQLLAGRGQQQRLIVADAQRHVGPLEAVRAKWRSIRKIRRRTWGKRTPADSTGSRTGHQDGRWISRRGSRDRHGKPAITSLGSSARSEEGHVGHARHYEQIDQRDDEHHQRQQHG